jgi:hypothetical protein
MFTWLTLLIARCRAFFRVSRDDRELAHELDAHLAMATAEHMRRGLTPDQARRAAQLELGGLAQLHEAHRDVRGLPRLDSLLQDLRYALRTLRGAYHRPRHRGQCHGLQRHQCPAAAPAAVSRRRSPGLDRKRLRRRRA